MKKITPLLSLLLLMIFTSLQAALPDFTLAATTTPETCTGNGEVTANMTDLSVGSSLDITLYDQTGTTQIQTTTQNATATTFTYTFFRSQCRYVCGKGNPIFEW